MLFSELRTLADVDLYVRSGYAAIQADPHRAQPLPLGVAEAGPLMIRAVEVAGPAGMTLQELRRLFWRLGEDRYARGLKMARESGDLTEQVKSRPNRAGRSQQQVVLRAGTAPARPGEIAGW